METYTIRRIGRTLKGITEPVSGSLEAIVKFDHPESPHCVYNEQVALRLAQTVHAPVADGALVTVRDGAAYASLEVASPGISLPDLHDGLYGKAAQTYPNATAATVLFDIWIGNFDRHNNVKASLVTPHLPLFRAFDHSHALLNIESAPMRSIQRLREPDLVVRNHPFYRHVDENLLRKWADRISQTPPEYIDECCRFGRPFRNVSERLQASLANALKLRAALLPRLIEIHRDRIIKAP